jgi:hypothetical protein
MEGMKHFCIKYIYICIYIYIYVYTWKCHNETLSITILNKIVFFSKVDDRRVIVSAWGLVTVGRGGCKEKIWIW